MHAAIFSFLWLLLVVSDNSAFNIPPVGTVKNRLLVTSKADVCEVVFHVYDFVSNFKLLKLRLYDPTYTVGFATVQSTQVSKMKDFNGINGHVIMNLQQKRKLPFHSDYDYNIPVDYYTLIFTFLSIIKIKLRMK